MEGWAYSEYLSTGSGNAANAPNIGNQGGLIVWPMSGGEWEISQGYNGPYSHYNDGGNYQYYYSFDLAQTDGSSAGTAIYSPVSGTVRWTEAGSGGMSIDIGNGYAFALFHVTVDSGLSAGDSVSQGQYIGTISGPGGNGYMGFEHVHISLWQTSDGGNWSRTAVPFSGDFAISGWDFPDIGGSNQHAGTVFYP
jgi:murein DD-endopeptidase MepM/ murein hydrolase activator NlpD